MKSRVYIVFWFGAFEDWRVVKAFATEEKAREFVKSKGDSHVWMEVELDN